MLTEEVVAGELEQHIEKDIEQCCSERKVVHEEEQNADRGLLEGADGFGDRAEDSGQGED